MQAMLELIKRLYPLRTCHLALTPENIQANKFRVCLEYHIKNCKGPCIGAQSHEEYMKNIASIKELLKGNTQKISQGMMREMMRLAEEMKFEEAQKIKRSTKDKGEIRTDRKLPFEERSGQFGIAQHRRICYRSR